MDVRTIVFFLLTPFVLVFIYAAWHEYGRFKREGPSSYGLTYDPETNTTHVGALPDDDDGFDPEDFDPEDTPDAEQTASDASDQDTNAQDIKS
ncbi:hypothetical protein [Roseovarius gahaiensis]|uniref:hypothetical protein n=1 Tax=Roseovarius gahaiensis TaxID=2716691 RepID=UPI0018C8BBED|nr:hypothetical protein [Roseovarius gahaiensis]